MAKYDRWLKEENLILIKGWKADGLTDEDIAKNMGIGIRTLYEWKERFPQISQAFIRGRTESDFIVQNAAFESCKDRIVKVIKPMKVKRSEFNDRGFRIKEWEEVVEVEEEVVIPANVLAQQFWLRNRKPEMFADGKIKEHDGASGEDKIDVQIVIADTSQKDGAP